MTPDTETLNSFFRKFPFKEERQLKTIDFRFFEKAIPKIIFDKLNRSTSPPNLNIFEGMNIGNNELKHCSLLSWFLNPSANHCQGQLFLELFLHKFKVKDAIKYINGGYFTVSTEDNFAEQGRVDIIISSSDFWFIIEAKILANEQTDQIARYNDILIKKSRVLGIPKSRCKLFFLTRDGRKSTTGIADYCISWKEIAEILNSYSSHCNNEYVSLTAKQYSKFITTNIGVNND
jgi:hypothetical protein